MVKGYYLKDGSYKIVDVKIKSPANLWRSFIEYFNSLKDGEEFSRQDMLRSIYDINSARALSNNVNTIDVYRRTCAKTGFVESISLGKYRKIHNLPDNITTSIINKKAKEFESKTWKEWFIPNEERVKEVIKACKNK
jgi:hypothetical protein